MLLHLIDADFKAGQDDLINKEILDISLRPQYGAAPDDLLIELYHTCVACAIEPIMGKYDVIHKTGST